MKFVFLNLFLLLSEYIPVPIKRKKLTGGVQHLTGSAGSEGYYKIDLMDKEAYLLDRQPSFTLCNKKEVICRSYEVVVDHIELLIVDWHQC